MGMARWARRRDRRSTRRQFRRLCECFGGLSGDHERDEVSWTREKRSREEQSTGGEGVLCRKSGSSREALVTALLTLSYIPQNLPSRNAGGNEVVFLVFLSSPSLPLPRRRLAQIASLRLKIQCLTFSPPSTTSCILFSPLRRVFPPTPLYSHPPPPLASLPPPPRVNPSRAVLRPHRHLSAKKKRQSARVGSSLGDWARERGRRGRRNWVLSGRRS